METESEVLLREIIDDLGDSLGLKVLAGETSATAAIREQSIQRPGLALAGFLDYFSARNLQIFGQTEFSYLRSLTAEARTAQWEAYVRRKPPGIMVSRGLELPDDLLAIADREGVCVVASSLRTEELIRKIELYFERRLSPSIALHGVLMDVFGLGVLILGDSGVGKSESALELLQRGHRLVSDDIVQVRRVRYDRLIGSSPDLTRHHIEIRGLGILSIRQLYGASAIVDEMEIDLVAQLEIWKEDVEYDRLGLEQETAEVLGIEVPRVLVPVRPGRNIAIIIEVGAMNQRLKNMGVHAAAEFSRRLDDILHEKRGVE